MFIFQMKHKLSFFFFDQTLGISPVSVSCRSNHTSIVWYSVMIVHDYELKKEKEKMKIS